jgi:hypothetical protein
MSQFDLISSQHYCGGAIGFSASATASFKNYVHQTLHKGQTLSEGTPTFDEFRRQSLREVERRIFLAASNFRRGEDLMILPSAPWSWITMYYASFHAAHAILGMLGVTIDPHSRHIWVQASSPGSQALKVEACPPLPAGTKLPGPHERFWDMYYQHTVRLQSDLPPLLKGAAVPIGGRARWQIEYRNLQNYDTFVAFQTMGDFSSSFAPATYPSSLGRNFARQVEGAKTMVTAAVWIADKVGLSSDIAYPPAGAAPRTARLQAVFHGNTPPFPSTRPLL